jgi:hypothetical protein
MHMLEDQNHIMYDSWDEYYSVHTMKEVVNFHMDDQGLPYIDLDKSLEQAVTLLMQMNIKGMQFKVHDGMCNMHRCK